MDKAPDTKNSFKVVDLKPDAGLVVIDLGDGRYHALGVKDGIEVKKGATVALDKTELDKNDVPAGAVVAKVL